jgi:hypothetical protein
MEKGVFARIPKQCVAFSEPCWPASYVFPSVVFTNDKDANGSNFMKQYNGYLWHVARLDETNSYTITVKKPLRKCPLGRRRRILDDNIKMNVRGVMSLGDEWK